MLLAHQGFQIGVGLLWGPETQKQKHSYGLPMDDIDDSVVLGLPLLKLVDLEPQIILDLKSRQIIKILTF